MEMAIESALGLQVINIILLAILIYIYARNCCTMKFKSDVTLGLLIFASLLLVQNLVGLYLGLDYYNSMTLPFEHYAFAINFIETIALVALFWITWK